MLGGHDAHYIHVVWVIASAIGAAAVVALVVIYRRAARREELDEAERILAEDD
jgi:cbb3-type cytochrome oxidase subunit 3